MSARRCYYGYVGPTIWLDGATLQVSGWGFTRGGRVSIVVSDNQTGQVIAPAGLATVDASGGLYNYAPRFTVSCYYWGYHQLLVRAYDVTTGRSATTTGYYRYPGVCY